MTGTINYRTNSEVVVLVGVVKAVDYEIMSSNLMAAGMGIYTRYLPGHLM